MDVGILEIIKLFFLIGTPISTICWYIYKKMDTRQDKLEVRMDVQDKKMTELEKAYIEMKTEFKFTSRDIKDIKEMIGKLVR